MHNIVNVIPHNSITLCQNNIIHNVIYVGPLHEIMKLMIVLINESIPHGSDAYD